MLSYYQLKVVDFYNLPIGDVNKENYVLHCDNFVTTLS